MATRRASSKSAPVKLTLPGKPSTMAVGTTAVGCPVRLVAASTTACWLSCTSTSISANSACHSAARSRRMRLALMYSTAGIKRASRIALGQA